MRLLPCLDMISSYCFIGFHLYREYQKYLADKAADAAAGEELHDLFDPDDGSLEPGF